MLEPPLITKEINKLARKNAAKYGNATPAQPLSFWPEESLKAESAVFKTAVLSCTGNDSHSHNARLPIQTLGELFGVLIRKAGAH